VIVLPVEMPFPVPSTVVCPPEGRAVGRGMPLFRVEGRFRTILVALPVGLVLKAVEFVVGAAADAPEVLLAGSGRITELR